MGLLEIYKPLLRQAFFETGIDDAYLTSKN